MGAPREVIVRGRASGFAQSVETAKGRLAVDEPSELGGTDTGPTPYDLLLGALGSCTSMTVGLYARRHGWPLEDVTVRLMHERVHETDCEDCVDEKPRWLERITLRLELSGPLSNEQRARLIEIAGRCPVHKTLTSNIEIRIE